MSKKAPLLPPQTPLALLSVIQTYASVLFKREADQYEQFRNDRNYAPWLAELESRTVDRVFRTLRAIENDSHGGGLSYHGLNDDKIRKGLGEVLFQIRNAYVWNPPQLNRQFQTSQPESVKSKRSDRSVAVPVADPNLATQIKHLQTEARMTAEEMAEEIGIQPRNVYRHLKGASRPRPRQIAAYEALFSRKLGRTVRLEMSEKRQ